MNALVFKYRGLLWGIFAVAVFAFPVSFSPIRMLLAIPLLAAGQLLRFWAAGVIPKYRTLTLAAPKLVTWGPYELVRNPLYLGNALMGCGWSLMVGWLWLPAFAVVYWIIYSLVIIPYEEQFLFAHFGDEYLDYQSKTPPLVPNVARFSSLADFRGFLAKAYRSLDREKSWFMERHSLRMNLLVTLLILFRLFLTDY